MKNKTKRTLKVSEVNEWKNRHDGPSLICPGGHEIYCTESSFISINPNGTILLDNNL